MQVRHSLHRIWTGFYRYMHRVHVLDSVPNVTASVSKELLRHPVVFWINHHTSFSNLLSTVQKSPSQFLRCCIRLSNRCRQEKLSRVAAVRC